MKRLFVLLGWSVLVLGLLSGCADGTPSFDQSTLPGIPRNQAPYLICRTQHTQDYRATSNSPDYDITCWTVATPTPAHR